METDLLYWMIEYGKVFCGYLLLMFLWPSVVFRGHLRMKSKTYWFGFCATATVIILNTVVLGAGLLHILSPLMIRFLFYGVFVCALLKNAAAYLNRKYRSMMEARFPDVRILYGKYRVLVIVILFFMVCYTYAKGAARYLSLDYIKRLKSCNRTMLKMKIKEKIWSVGSRMNDIFWQYGFLALVLVFGILYFSYGAFQMQSYGYGDLYVHHAWIYELMEDNIFSAGIYPAAMHCFIYAMHVLLGIRVYSILLFLQGIHVAVFLLSVYFLFRQVFQWRYTPIFVLVVFLTLDLKNAEQIKSMFRLQITLPQEFGLYTVCLCALYLIRYLGRKQLTDKKEKGINFFRDENLLLFTLSLAVSIATHFHVVIMAFFICLSVSVFALKKIFDRRNFVSLLSAVFVACLISAAPMAGAMAQRIPFNASINWAIRAMEDEGNEKDRQAEEEQSVQEGLRERKQSSKKDRMTVTSFLIAASKKIYTEGYVMLYGQRRACAVLFFTLAGLALWRWARVKLKIPNCLPVILASAFYVILYAAPGIGMPDLIPEGRFFAVGHMMILAVTAIPIDVIFGNLASVCKISVLQIMSLLTAGGIYAGMVASGNFRGYLFYELSRYNSAVAVTNTIIDRFPKYNYTIVSPTDELYPVIEYGWHEELLTFIKKTESDTYTLPSEYVFLFIEKKPLLYAQANFFDGPAWMGEKKYLSLYEEWYSGSEAVQGPAVKAGQISEQEAQKNLPESSDWSTYLQLSSRTVLESKAYEWCQDFEEKYPSALNIYYEDDAFVCYYFRQDVDNGPYDLAFQ